MPTFVLSHPVEFDLSLHPRRAKPKASYTDSASVVAQMSRNEDHSETIIQFQVGETVPVRDKVVAAPWQVAALHQLLRRAGENPPKEEILQTSKETGLWVTRELEVDHML